MFKIHTQYISFSSNLILGHTNIICAVFCSVSTLFFAFQIVLIYKSDASRKKYNCPNKFIFVVLKNFSYKK